MSMIDILSLQLHKGERLHDIPEAGEGISSHLYIEVTNVEYGIRLSGHVT